MAFYSYLSTKIIIAFITKSYQDLFGVRSYINAYFFQLNDEYPEKVCCIGMLFHSLNKDRKIK